MSVRCGHIQYVDFDPPQELQDLVQSLVSHDDYRQALEAVQHYCRPHLDSVNIDEFLATPPPVHLSQTCDKTPRSFGVTVKSAPDAKPVIYTSEKMYLIFESSRDPAVGLMIAVTIAHEFVHAFIRSSKLLETPQKVRQYLKTADAGFYAEQILFENLGCSKYGLEIWASNLPKDRVWFPKANKHLDATWAISSHLHVNNHYCCLTDQYVKNLYQTGIFRRPEKADTISKSQPGDVRMIAKRCEEDLRTEHATSEDAEIATSSLAGFVRMEAMCPHARD